MTNTNDRIGVDDILDSFIDTKFGGHQPEALDQLINKMGLPFYVDDDGAYTTPNGYDTIVKAMKAYPGTPIVW